MNIYNKNKKTDKPESDMAFVHEAAKAYSDTGLSLPGRVIPDGGATIPGRQFPITDPVQQGIPGGKTYLNVKEQDTDGP